MGLEANMVQKRSVLGICKSVYRAMLPLSLRTKLFLLMPAPLQRLKLRLVSRLEKNARHDEIYDAEYYAKTVEPGMAVSACQMADSLVKEFAPKLVVDVGCGTGGLMMALRGLGVQCTGLEYAKAAIEICRQRGLNVLQFDLESGEPCELRADLAVSTEVAEHLPASCADAYVGLLCAIAPMVVLTAAPPTEHGGTDHVNEQPNEYWIEKFTARGRQYQKVLSIRLREQWNHSNVSGIYGRSLMIFGPAGQSTSCEPQTKDQG
jgi:SAM-dependent methyltransferase